jgi:hypothetical protein
MKRLSRRTVLKGIGAGVALPLLEAMVQARSGVSASPRRLVFVYVPIGAHMPAWTPVAEGAGFELSPTLEPLAPFREDLLVLSGLTHDKARANGDGPGDHARAAAAFLTGAQPRKTAGADIRAGISADQVAAQAVGARTRFRSLELGCEPGRSSGDCDSGYACVYSNNISWASASTPMTKETDPRALFDRLFLGGVTPEDRARRAELAASQRSILDYVREDAERLSARLGAGDREKLGEYMESLRELERRIAAFSDSRAPDVDLALRPTESPDDLGAHARLMFDLLVLAFRTDSTRIATLMITNEGSNRSYPEVGVSEGHHEVSHHGDDPVKQEKIARINRYHVELFAQFLGALRGAGEGESDLLASSMVVYGSAIADGNRHDHHDLPILLAGRGGGTLATGRHVRYPKETPATNLFLALLERMEAAIPSLGDSTKVLTGLDAV